MAYATSVQAIAPAASTARGDLVGLGTLTARLGWPSDWADTLILGPVSALG